MWKRICIAVALAVSGIAVAEGPGMAAKMENMTTDQRSKMADAHEKMAACLRSTRPVKECHQEMKKSCQEVMGKDNCPMMGRMGRHHAEPATP
ncbi:MAG: hypothetical protein ACYCWW_10095 [Deltaproteobacteria bacterium]